VGLFRPPVSRLVPRSDVCVSPTHTLLLFALLVLFIEASSGVCPEESNDAMSANDPKKYVVSRYDFRRLPRWPNDGIEQERQKMASGEAENFRHETTDRDHLALQELLGGYPCGEPLDAMPNDDFIMGRGFVLALPSLMQKQAAEEQGDLTSAKAHLIEAYKRKDSDVLSLLETIGCKKAVYKAVQDPRRFPNFDAILIPLFRHNLATDANVELLFGAVSRVRALLLEIGANMADPPPENSPMGAYMSQFHTERVKPAPKVCAQCGTKDGSLRKCVDCKSVCYCSKECQRKAWPVHKPDCLEIQGKLVSESVRQKADETKEAWEKEKALENERKQTEFVNEVRESLAEFKHEHPSHVETVWHNCYGRPRKAHLPLYAVEFERGIAQSMELKYEEELSLGMFPDGISEELYGRGVLLSDPANDDAKIMILHERLFDNGGDGNLRAHALDGIFVVDSVVNRKAKWKRVAEPVDYPGDYNRCSRFVAYLIRAKNLALSTASDVDLGIDNPGDPNLTMIETSAGKLLRVGNPTFI